MGWYLPHSSGNVTLRGTSRTSRAIKALLSPVPPRHPWLRHTSTWAGNLSSCRLAVTLKPTSYDELQCKALWNARWCLPEQIICCHYTSLGGWSITSVKVFRRVRIKRNILSSCLRRSVAFMPPAKLWTDTHHPDRLALTGGWSAALKFNQSGTSCQCRSFLIRIFSQLRVSVMFFQTHVAIARIGWKSGYWNCIFKGFWLEGHIIAIYCSIYTAIYCCCYVLGG